MARSDEWPVDVLGRPYYAETIDLPPDDEGEVVATLVRRRGRSRSRKAVLHVHGFADYFFQTVAADYWLSRGYDFYALDLRKYGRSLRPHQTPNFTTDLTSYYAELDEAYRRVTERDGHDHVVMSGHSTGGLVVPLWLHDEGAPVDGMVLNSPWLDLHGSLLLRTAGTKAIDQIGARRPYLTIPREVNGFYARSLHRDHDGEWPFDLAWKPLESWPVYAGWLRAVRRGHARVHRGLDLDVPVLVLTSDASAPPARVGRDLLEQRHRARRAADPEVGAQAVPARHTRLGAGRAARRHPVAGRGPRPGVRRDGPLADRLPDPRRRGGACQRCGEAD